MSLQRNRKRGQVSIKVVAGLLEAFKTRVHLDGVPGQAGTKQVMCDGLTKNK